MLGAHAPSTSLSLMILLLWSHGDSTLRRSALTTLLYGGNIDANIVIVDVIVVVISMLISRISLILSRVTVLISGNAILVSGNIVIAGAGTFRIIGTWRCRRFVEFALRCSQT